jgi:hypothetical protein
MIFILINFLSIIGYWTGLSFSFSPIKSSTNFEKLFLRKVSRRNEYHQRSFVLKGYFSSDDGDALMQREIEFRGYFSDKIEFPDYQEEFEHLVAKVGFMTYNEVIEKLGETIKHRSKNLQPSQTQEIKQLYLQDHTEDSSSINFFLVANPKYFLTAKPELAKLTYGLTIERFQNILLDMHYPAIQEHNRIITERMNEIIQIDINKLESLQKEKKKRQLLSQIQHSNETIQQSNSVDELINKEEENLIARLARMASKLDDNLSSDIRQKYSKTNNHVPPSPVMLSPEDQAALARIHEYEELQRYLITPLNYSKFLRPLIRNAIKDLSILLYLLPIIYIVDGHDSYGIQGIQLNFRYIQHRLLQEISSSSIDLLGQYRELNQFHPISGLYLSEDEKLGEILPFYKKLKDSTIYCGGYGQKGLKFLMIHKIPDFRGNR